MLTIHNHLLHVEIAGQPNGFPVVLLHHGLGSVQAWRAQIPALIEAGYHVIAYDRWGYGQSEARPFLKVPGFEDDLADLGCLLDTLEIERAALVGHSDGGTIALYFTVQQPERVAALVTVAAHIYVEPKMEPGIAGIRQAFEHDARFRKGMQRIHGEKFESVFRNWFEGWHTPTSLAWDMRPLLAQIRCPALVIQGEKDEHATPQHAREIAAAIGAALEPHSTAELWLAEGAAHMLPQENPEIFNQKLIEFLQRSSA